MATGVCVFFLAVVAGERSGLNEGDVQCVRCSACGAVQPVQVGRRIPMLDGRREGIEIRYGVN